MGSAFAYFEDTEVSTDNSFEMGTWAVATSEGGGDTASFTFHNLAAGTGGSKTWAVTNTGTISAYVDLNINVSESGNGSLGDFLLVRLYVVGYAGNIYGSDDSLLPISGAGGNYNLNLELWSGESPGVTLDWTVSDDYEAGDGDKVVFTISFNINPAP